MDLLTASFQQRLTHRKEELVALFTALYPSASPQSLLNILSAMFQHRSTALKERDLARFREGDWYAQNDLCGIMLYAPLFGGSLKGVTAQLDYLLELGVNYLHLMPLLKMPQGENDGGYAVSDFQTVDPAIGTNADLETLCQRCHEEGISVCIDFILNHTADSHLWAEKAKMGDQHFQNYYFFYDSKEIPHQLEKTMPEVFPTTAPGNFTYLPQIEKYVMTTFYPYQWDLNYGYPPVFCSMVENLLFLANLGIDVFRMDAVPYIVKELGTSCRNLPAVHLLVRMLRLICEIVCPSVILLGEVVMAPHEVTPYFGSVEKPECHLLYNVTTSVCIWNSLATGDCHLLNENLRGLSLLPSPFIFLNYIRCHDDIGWGLDEEEERRMGMDPLVHKQYLYRFYSGQIENSFATGMLYNEDTVAKDARNCGTCGSLCGIEKALADGSESQLQLALKRHLLVHGVVFALRGIPTLYSGDEIGQLNDYAFQEDPAKAQDSRFLHRGVFPWNYAAKRHDPSSPAGILFSAIRKMITLKKEHGVFHAHSKLLPLPMADRGLCAFCRQWQGEELVCIYNFSHLPKKAKLPYNKSYTDLFTQKLVDTQTVLLEPYGFCWLKAKTHGGIEDV